MKWLISAFGHEQINRSNWAVLQRALGLADLRPDTCLDWCQRQLTDTHKADPATTGCADYSDGYTKMKMHPAPFAQL
jgi:hypothetical protein